MNNDNLIGESLFVRGLLWSWPGRPGVLGHWSETLAPGLTVLVGGDGSGKSTRLRLLAAAQAPSAGQLSLQLRRQPVSDKPRPSESPADALRDPLGLFSAWPDPSAYRRHVFWCDPASEALDGLGAAAYVDHHRQRQPAWQEPLFQALLADLQLQGHLHKPLLGLSMGMRRKLRIACAVASGAPLTLVDEPLAALDRGSVATVTGLLMDCAAAAQRLFVTTAHESPDPTWGARALWLADSTA